VSDTSPLPAAGEADPEKQSTPAGMTEDLEEKAEDESATTGGDEPGEPPD